MAMQTLVQALEERVERPRDIFTVKKEFLDFCRCTGPTEALNDFLHGVTEDAWAYPGMLDFQKFSLAAGATYELQLGIQHLTTPRAVTSPMNGLYYVHSGPPLICDLYKIPDSWDPEEFDRDLVLAPPERVAFDPGECVEIRGSDYLLDILSTGSLLIKALSADWTSKVWAISRESRKAEFMFEASIADSKMILVLKALATVGNETSVESLTRLVRVHPNYSIRWLALQTAAALSADSAEGLVRQALEDSNGMIRRAAIKTLQANGLAI